ncbi:hypothetical protein CHUAL_004524 [Chamberlinius hualienensis]
MRVVPTDGISAPPVSPERLCFSKVSSIHCASICIRNSECLGFNFQLSGCQFVTDLTIRNAQSISCENCKYYELTCAKLCQRYQMRSQNLSANNGSSNSFYISSCACVQQGSQWQTSQAYDYDNAENNSTISVAENSTVNASTTILPSLLNSTAYSVTSDANVISVTASPDSSTSTTLLTNSPSSQENSLPTLSDEDDTFGTFGVLTTEEEMVENVIDPTTETSTVAETTTESTTTTASTVQPTTSSENVASTPNEQSTLSTNDVTSQSASTTNTLPTSDISTSDSTLITTDNTVTETTFVASSNSQEATTSTALTNAPLETSTITSPIAIASTTQITTTNTNPSTMELVTTSTFETSTPTTTSPETDPLSTTDVTASSDTMSVTTIPLTPSTESFIETTLTTTIDTTLLTSSDTTTSTLASDTTASTLTSETTTSTLATDTTTIIKNSTRHSAIANYVTANGVPTRKYWIGLKSTASLSPTWSHQDNSPLESYQPWAAGSTPSITFTCARAYITYEEPLKWYCDGGNTKYYFICDY